MSEPGMPPTLIPRRPVMNPSGRKRPVISGRAYIRRFISSARLTRQLILHHCRSLPDGVENLHRPGEPVGTLP
jgi:hypothetical protein